MAETGPDDGDLLESARAGDRSAFDALVVRHWRLLYRMAWGVLHDDRDAEDAAQEAWVKVWTGLDSYAGGAKVTTWLSQIAIHTAIDHLRARRRRPVVLPEPVEMHADTLADPAPAAQGDPFVRAALARAREALSPRQRAVFDLHAAQGLEFDAIGALVGCGASSARQHYFRAVRRLRAALKEYDA